MNVVNCKLAAVTATGIACAGHHHAKPSQCHCLTICTVRQRIAERDPLHNCGGLPATRTAQPAAPWYEGMWAEFHGYEPIGDVAADQAWFDRFSGRVACGECRDHWTALTRAHPPDWAHWHAYTHARHNDVNRRIGRPELPYADAAARWGWHDLAKAEPDPSS
ncbi:MAG TPA: hypothetical protein VGN72_10050 [Tepidisphaeraceae bacterium]|jgi:hypothetical protein|nr:hypothetical protein [Tepidisphaeraceae bacterium]